MENHEQVKISTGNIIPAKKENQKVDDVKSLRNNCIKEFWDNKTPKQKKAEKDKEIEELINKKNKK